MSELWEFIWRWLPLFFPNLHEAVAMFVQLYTYIVRLLLVGTN